MLEVRPSRYLPEYLKADLRVGEAEQNALLTALDLFCQGLSASCFQKTFDLVGNSTSTAVREQELERLGLRFSSLATAEVNRLYEMRSELLSTRGNLASLFLLSELYFPGATIQRGLPYSSTRVSENQTQSLTDVEEGHRVIFVRAAVPVPQERGEEFLFNARKFVTAPYQIRIADPVKPAPERARLNLAFPQSWEKRRVECLISLK